MWSVSWQTAETCGLRCGKAARPPPRWPTTFSPMGSGCTSVSRALTPFSTLLLCVCVCLSWLWLELELAAAADPARLGSIHVFAHPVGGTYAQYIRESPMSDSQTARGPCMRRTWEFPSSLLFSAEIPRQAATSPAEKPGTSSCRPHPLSPTLPTYLPTGAAPTRPGRVANFPLRPHRPVASIHHSSQSRRAQPLTQADHFTYFAHGWSLPSRLSPRGHLFARPVPPARPLPQSFFLKQPLLGRPREANAGGRSLTHTKRSVAAHTSY